MQGCEAKLRASSCRLTRYALLPFLPVLLLFFFFSVLAVENGDFQSSCGVGERRSREQLRRRSPSSRSSSLFFFFFSILAVENGGIRSCSVIGERRSCCVVGVGSSGKKKTTQPKTTSFWVGVIFFKNQNTPKRRRFEVNFFLKSEHPKRRRFEVFYYYYFLKTASPKRRCFGLPATKTTPF